MNPNQPARAGVRRAHLCRRAGIVATVAIFILLIAVPRAGAQGRGASAGGGSDLVSLDFSTLPLGAPPKEVRVTAGKLDIVEKDGVHMLRSSEEATFLVMLSEKIPNHFVLEFDIVPKFSGATNTTELSFEGTRDVSHSEESAHVHWSHNKVSVIGGGQTYAGGQIDLPEDLKEEVIGNLTQVRAEFDGSNLTVKTNGRTVFESKIAKFLRGRVLRVQLGGTDDGENAVYLARLRMTAGSRGAGATAQQSRGGGTSPGTTDPVDPDTIPPDESAENGMTDPVDPDVIPPAEGMENGMTDPTTSAQQGTIPAGSTTPASITGLVAQVNEFGGAWANWDYVPGAVSCFTVCWNTADPYGPKFTSSPDHPPGTGMQIGVLTAAGTYGFRVYAKTATGVVTGETQFQFAGAANQQAGTTVSSPPSTGSTSEEAAITEVTGIAVNVAADGNVRVSWDMAEDALSYFAICWDREITRSFQLASPPEFLSNAWEVGVLPAAGDYAVRVFCKLQSGGYVAGEAMFTYGGAANQQAGTTTGGTQPSSTGSSGEGTTAGTDTGVVLRVNGDGGAIGMWDPVPDATSYFAVLWNASSQNTTPWVTSSQDFNNARMLPGSGSTGWQIGILPSPGSYVLRVYATTAGGGVATGEAQANFDEGSTMEAAGTIRAAAPATDTGVVLTINNDGGAIGQWDPVPDATAYLAVLWNATNQNTAPWVTSSQDFNNARMLPGSNTAWQIGIVPSPGTYILRVYATTASGGIATGEAQANFAGVSSQQAGTTATSVSASVTGIVVRSIDNATVSITWDPVPDAISYVVSRWNLFDPDCCNWTSVPVPTPAQMAVSMPPVTGAFGFRVVATTPKGDVVGETQIQFAGAGNQQAGTTVTSPTGGSVQDPALQPAPTVQSGNYKVTITGLSVYSPTNDDPSVVDGFGDEVFVCAALVEWDRGSAGERSYSSVKSVDYGDVADGRYAGRVRAGSASQTGGLGRQDMVPGNFDPFVSPSGTAQPEHLPLVMWQGSLTAGREILVLSPSVWEHDGTRNILESYIALWNSCSKAALMESLPVVASLTDLNVGASEAVFFPEILNGAPATSFVTPPWTGYKFARATFNAGVDRPIGFEIMPGQPDVLKYGERFVIITQEKLASLQVGQGMTVPVNYVESSEPNIGGGNYQLHVRIERTQ